MSTRATAASVSAESVGFMSATVRTPRPALHPQVRRSPKIRAVGLALGCSEATAEKKLYGPHAVNLETAAVIEVLIRRGETVEAAAFEAPIRAVMMGDAIPDWREAQYRADCRDAAEDARQAEWVREQSDEHLENYIKSLATNIYAEEVLLAALIIERDKRQAEK